MRAISQPVNTYSVALGTKELTQSQKVLPGFGAIEGLILELTATLAGATASQTSNTIDNVISAIAVTDKNGKEIMSIRGTDLYLLQQVMTVTGQIVSPAGVTTDASGDGSQTYNLLLPLTIAQADMNAKVSVTFAASSSLVNANLVSAGAASVTLDVRALYTAQPVPTLRIKASDVLPTSGDNSFGPFLPQGLQEVALAVYANGNTVAHATLSTAGAAVVQRQTETAFQIEDELFLQGFHYVGMLIFRVPVFTVDSTTVFDVNFSAVVANSNARVLSFAVAPQKRN